MRFIAILLFKLLNWRRPILIPIERIEDYHTHYLGQTSDGRLFWGYETFVFTKPPGEHGAEWQEHRKEYVVLHTFDKKGNYLQTAHWFAGTTSEIRGDEMQHKLEEMISELGPIQFGDIRIKTFSTMIDGVEFGLIRNKKYGCIELEPSSTISFQWPWDGSYYT